MSLGTLILTAALAQNVILVHFLGPWPFPALLSSVRRSLFFSLAITGALLWVSVLYAGLYRYVFVPLAMEFLATFGLVAVLSVSYLFWMRVASWIAPFASRAVRRAVPIVFFNATVFVVPMALAEKVDLFAYIPAAALAAGAGLFLAIVPVAAVYEHLRTARLPRILRGNALILLVTAVFALALQQLDVLLATLAFPLW